MASIFSSWIGSNKLNVDPDQASTDPSRPRASSSASNTMPPIDRATSMTPKAHLQLSHQPEWSMSPRDHHREASEATLSGRAPAHRAAHRYDSETQPNHAPLAKPTASRPASVGNASELSHERLTQVSSTLGGVDSEAAWSAAHSSDAARSSVPRRRKKLAPPELLVIVKPPPSKQANPLNLQIQLVMPQQLLNRRDGSQRGSSMDSSVPLGELSSAPSTELRRRDSITSTRSAGSEISASGSVASTSSGRRVTPLYNLNYHHILSTTVSDAGTDQKIAKYVRKGVDLDNFGILEPMELVNGVNDLATLHRDAAMNRGSSILQAGHGTNIAPRSEASSSGGVDDSSAFSAPARQAAGFNANAATPSQEPPTSFQAMTPEARGVEANLGGKLLGKFKRFSLNVRPSSSSGAGNAFARDSGSNTNGITAGASAAPPSRFGKLTQSDPGRGHGSGEIPQMQPGAGVADGRRTEGYYWTVRRWNRQAYDGIPTNLAGRTTAVNAHASDAEGSNPVLTNVWKRFNLVNRMGGNELHPPPSQIPVRFEWSRFSKRQYKRRHAKEAQARLRTNGSLNASVSSIDHLAGMEASRNNAPLHQPHTTSASAQSLGVDDSSRLGAGDAARSTSRPSSLIYGAGSHRSPRHSVDTSAAGSSALHGDDDTGDESDPEDSETPWNCHLVLGPTTRIPLGTLSPAPHHPKLVGQLAVPFPLPDLSGTGLGPDAAGLTREELKDVIIVTCLHLIVRESFGGLANTRKSNASMDAAVLGAGATNMANVNGWRLASIPKKK
ncbi:uncharacterized protein MEPE_00860 [Melanopsichium pennsylvanicum]|uniref:Uncharacterized protein n=2 Tax=Melanopsichium pennsylvanicum TaxID=63383 RepID=A0AAJ5C365_9BASI|nr:conserved hypothetical protein [Melanopsichium pennsylvanicum 4]SNX82154.1 uncharacterized protein MEPE_00860 [Melanopsichium pennsylvanicum]